MLLSDTFIALKDFFVIHRKKIMRMTTINLIIRGG